MAHQIGHLASALSHRYVIERELGSGAMATVYLARDLKHERHVAMKVLRPELVASLLADRFLHEIKVTARLNHPHILALFDSGEADGYLYYAMPFAEGESLRDRLNRERQLPIDEALAFAREIADALSYAHSRGIVHRDIKPENILMLSGHAVISDFGIARAISAATDDHQTATGMAIGTPAYMSPEQAAGNKDVDGRADLYSLGCLLYEMLAGQPPFIGPTVDSVVRQQLSAVPPSITVIRPAVPEWVAAVLGRALAKTPADRFKSVAQFTDAIAAHKSDVVSRADAARVTRRQTALAAASAAVVALGLIAAVIVRSKTSVKVVTGPPSLAVLPLVNASGDTANQYLVDGLTDEITGAIARISGLRVASRSAASTVDTRGPINVPSVAQRLSVSAVLEGRARLDGGRLRLWMQLNAADGLSLWSESYQREVKDVFQVQEDIARSIASALSVALTGNAQRAFRPTTNAAAHDLVLRGRYQLNLYTEPSLRQAASFFEKAISLDSTYVDAWAGLADSWARLADVFIPASEAIPHLRAAAARAIALDSMNVSALTQAASLKMFYDRVVAEPERLFKHALALDSSNDVTSIWYAYYLVSRRRGDSAAAVLRRLQRNDPMNRLLARDGAAILGLAGHIDEARDLCRRAMELDSLAYGHCRRIIWTIEGNHNLVLADCRRGGDFRCAATALGRMNRKEEAKREAARAEEQSRGRYVPTADMAIMWAWVGNLDRALLWLERTELHNGANLVDLAWSPAYDPLRGDPRFRALVGRTAPRDP